MTRAKNTNRATERRILKKYLTRYYRAKKKQEILQNRQKRLQSELYPTTEKGEALTAPEIEGRIQAQAEAAERSILEVMDILEFLPANSTERIIMELRHLDCKSWAEIYRTVYMTHSPCFKYYNRGLDALLVIDEVRHLLKLS